MAERLSPLAGVFRPGSHGRIMDGIGVVLSQPRPQAIMQVAAWRGREKALMATVARVAGLELPDGAGAGVVMADRAAFGFAPGRFLLVADQAETLSGLRDAVDADTGTVTDLSHGRTAIRIAGPRAEWVLAKFFALDFSLPAFPLHAGRATVHHDIFALIQRTGADAFDVYVFRSFARSFWTALCHASEEVGYEVR